MADTKLADLTALTTPSGDDILYIVDDPAGTPLDRKITLDNLFTRGTITADAPVLNMAQTWNNAAVTFTALKFNAAGTSDANSASASLLMDLQVGLASQASIDKRGTLSFAAPASGTVPSRPGVGNWFGSLGLFGNSGVLAATVSSTSINFGSSYQLSWNTDLILTRRGTANLRLGAADAAGSAIAINSVATNQLTLASSHGLTSGAAVIITGTTAPSGTSLNTLYYARSISAAVIELYLTFDNATATSGTTGIVAVTTAGTSASIRLATPFQRLSPQDFTGTDIPGQPLLINGSRGTGTGPGGSIIFQVAPAGSTGTAQNALATAWSISGAGHFLAGTDNTYDIGASGATRPRNIFAAGYVKAAGANGFWAGSTSFIFWDARTQMAAPASNVLRVDDPSSNAAIIQTRQFAVANLPSAVAYPGSMAFVSDATATTARSTVAGGGSNKVMVMSDGTNWLIVA